MKQLRASLTIKGRVQGVFFRQSTRETAVSLGATGWVRNLPDGSVAAVVEGPEIAVRQVIAWCRQGPAAARVDSVTVDWHQATGEFTAFTIR
ncbi:MAG: acylphosphatase [Desulfuromonadales bacterium]|nr:acylphosphatase [Desulfuromonadales bacterium]